MKRHLRAQWETLLKWWQRQRTRLCMDPVAPRDPPLTFFPLNTHSSAVCTPPPHASGPWLTGRAGDPPCPRTTPPTQESAFWLELSSQSTIRGELTGPPSLSPQIMALWKTGRRNAKWDMNSDRIASERSRMSRIDSGANVTGPTGSSEDGVALRMASFFSF